MEKKRVYLKLPEGFKCSCCDFSAITRQAVTSHWWRNHTDSGKGAFGGHAIGSPAWNKGKTSITDSRVLSGNIHPNKGKHFGSTLTGHSIETRAVISKRLSGNNKGGRCKWYLVAGQKVQGTWERNIALKFEEVGISWVKLKTNKDVLQYVMHGKVRSYTPDFFLPLANVYLEIKGFWWGNDKEKMSLVIAAHKDKRIVVIEKDGYEKILHSELVW